MCTCASRVDHRKQTPGYLTSPTKLKESILHPPISHRVSNFTSFNTTNLGYPVELASLHSLSDPPPPNPSNVSHLAVVSGSATSLSLLNGSSSNPPQSPTGPNIFPFPRFYFTNRTA